MDWKVARRELDRAASAEGGDSVADLNDQEVAAERSAGGLLLEGQGAGFFSFSSGQESEQPRENRCPRGANSGWMCGTRQASGHSSGQRTDASFRMEEIPVI